MLFDIRWKLTFAKLGCFFVLLVLIVTMCLSSIEVVDHYENPRNVGSLDKNDKNVGTGLVGAPACGDVMKLQVSRSCAGMRHCSTFTQRL